MKAVDILPSDALFYFRYWNLQAIFLSTMVCCRSSPFHLTPLHFISNLLSQISAQHQLVPIILLFVLILTIVTLFLLIVLLYWSDFTGYKRYCSFTVTPKLQTFRKLWSILISSKVMNLFLRCCYTTSTL